MDCLQELQHAIDQSRCDTQARVPGSRPAVNDVNLADVVVVACDRVDTTRRELDWFWLRSESEPQEV